MQTRAKFVVMSITRMKWGAGTEIQTVKLNPVTNGSEEDKAFWAATPSGSIEIGVVNAEAAKAFELGATYYVDFTKAPE